MTAPETTNQASERVYISCPGCGRNDWVSWPKGQDSYSWTCFNCHKHFDLRRGGPQ